MTKKKKKKKKLRGPAKERTVHDFPPKNDAMRNRLPGSFESGKHR
jgi:hypothetical protein